jgi:hypothetical protein
MAHKCRNPEAPCSHPEHGFQEVFAPDSALFTVEEVNEAWQCLRRHNHSIPDECLDEMRSVLMYYADKE